MWKTLRTRKNFGFSLVETIVAIMLFVMVAGGLLQIRKFINDMEQTTKENLLLEYEWAYLDDIVRVFSIPTSSGTGNWYVVYSFSGITYSSNPHNENTSGGFLRIEDGMLSHRISPLSNSTSSGSVNTYKIQVWLTKNPTASKTIYTVKAYE